MNIVIVLLISIITQPLLVRRTLSDSEDPKKFITLAETSLIVAKQMKKRLTANTASSLLSRFA